MVRKKRHKKVIELVEGEGRRKKGVILGVDVHKEVLAYCFGNDTEIISEGTCGNTTKQISKLIQYCKDNLVQSVAMESTAQYHFKLLYALLDAQIPVLVANPRQTKDTQGKKTDKLDGRRIFVAHRDGRLMPSVISPKEVMELRKAMRRLAKITDQQTKIKQRLHQIFHQKELQLPVKTSDVLKTKWGLNVFLHFLDDDIRLLVETYYPKRRISKNVDLLVLGLQTFKSQLDEIEQITFRTDITQLVMFKNLADELRLVYIKLAEINENFKGMMKLLLTVPHVGPDIAARVLAEIVDISYFKKPEKLSKWAGLAPSVKQSGHRKRVTGKIHKGGNKYLRHVMFEACANIFSKGRESHPLKRFMKSKYRDKKKDSYKKAVCAAGRKLLVIIWHLLTRNQEWGCKTQDTSTLLSLQNLAQRKIKGFERMIRKYQKICEMLSQNVNNILEYSSYRGESPKTLLKALLQSV
jgi:transposase